MVKIKNYILLIALASLFQPKLVSAQSLALSVPPPLVEIMIQPGKETNQTVRLTNLGDDTYLKVNIAVYENGRIRDVSDSDRLPWLEFTSEKIGDKPFLVRKNEEIPVNLRLHPSLNSETKDYYRALTFSTIAYPHDPQTQVKVSQTIASILLISVTSSGLPKKAEIVSRPPRFIDSFDKLPLNIKVRNTGSTYFRPNGTVTLKGFIGKAGYPILPAAILVNEQKELLIEKNSRQATYLRGFFIGRYQLETSFVMDEGSLGVSHSSTFYAFPWKIGLLLIASFLTYRFLRAYRQRRVL